MKTNDYELPFNKNDRQFHFNRIKGEVTEINIPEDNKAENDWCSITLTAGHENQRQVNFSIKKSQVDELINDGLKLGAKVTVLFYLTSRFKNGRWYTTANVLQLDKV
jgi:hypothetical protein